MNRVLKKSIAWVLMLSVTFTMCFGNLSIAEADTSVEPALMVYEGDKLVKDYSLGDLEKIAEKEGNIKYQFSGYNRNPAFRIIEDAAGPTIEGILKDAGISAADNRLMTFIAPDQARESFIASDLFAERYYFPNGKKVGNLGDAAGAESYTDKEKVPAMINLNSKDKELLMGQIAPNEQNTAVQLKYMAEGGKLIIGDEQQEAWQDVAQANYNSGDILPETNIELDIASLVGKKVAIYYTTDGTEPTYGDAIYNYDKYGNTRTIAFAEEGTYTIKVKAIGYGKLDSSTTTFVYNVKDVDSPAVPTDFSATANTYNSVSLKWDSVSGADGYEVMRSEAASGTYQVIKDVKSAAAYIDAGLEADTTYKYKVRAYKQLSSGQKVYSSGTSAESVESGVGKPVLSKVSRTGYSSIQLYWNKVKFAQGYQIYRYDSVTKKWTYVKKITSGNTVSWKNTGLKTGRKYTYKVRAYADKTYSEFSSAKAATPTLSKPYISKVTAGKKSATVKWSRISGAGGYKIYRSTKKSSGYKVVKTIKKGTTTSWKNTGLKKGKKYYYKVKAYRIVDKKYVYSSISSSKYTTSR